MNDQQLAELYAEQAIQSFLNLTDIPEGIIKYLSQVSSQQLLDTRKWAQTLSKKAWLLECAADAEISNRSSLQNSG